jgi:ferredoxin
VKAHVDLDRCQGHGLCSMLAPDTFELDDDDRPIVADGDVPAEQASVVSDAAQLCPEQAIVLS